MKKDLFLNQKDVLYEDAILDELDRGIGCRGVIGDTSIFVKHMR